MFRGRSGQILGFKVWGLAGVGGGGLEAPEPPITKTGRLATPHRPTRVPYINGKPA
jgi:hypothetical protein